MEQKKLASMTRAGSQQARLAALREQFKYHSPEAEQLTQIDAIRKAALSLALTIELNCPDGPDKSAAHRKCREAMMTANAAIVLKDVPASFR